MSLPLVVEIKKIVPRSFVDNINKTSGIATNRLYILPVSLVVEEVKKVEGALRGNINNTNGKGANTGGNYCYEDSTSGFGEHYCQNKWQGSISCQCLW